LSEMLVFLSIPKEGAKISTTDAFHQLLWKSTGEKSRLATILRAH
jgi:hypothetical protein